MLVAIDTATPTVSVAIGDGGVTLGRVELTGGRRHAEQLVPAIQYLCAETATSIERLSAVAVGLGPGLFTGLRVGVATARMMASARRVPAVGIPSLDLVAYPLRHTTRLIVVIVDARRHEVFHARYRPVPGGVQRVSEYEVAAPADLVAELEADGEELLLAGDGALRYRDDFAELERAEQAGPAFATPSTAALVTLASARIEREEFGGADTLVPLYVRRSDAELNWERRGR